MIEIEILLYDSFHVVKVLIPKQIEYRIDIVSPVFFIIFSTEFMFNVVMCLLVSSSIYQPFYILFCIVRTCTSQNLHFHFLYLKQIFTWTLIIFPSPASQVLIFNVKYY